ncbi:hypothetical protein LCGC14_2660630, partial [marine sediment metagenome]
MKLQTTLGKIFLVSSVKPPSVITLRDGLRSILTVECSIVNELVLQFLRLYNHHHVSSGSIEREERMRLHHDRT